MKKSQLQKYAKLIARKGVNVQKGQDVRVRACPDQLDFVRMVVEECYKAGAGKVTVEWEYNPVTKATYKYCTSTRFPAQKSGKKRSINTLSKPVPHGYL